MNQLTALLAATCLLAGCAVETAPPASDFVSEPAAESESDISTNSLSYVALRPDYRKCVAPLCGGFWVKDLNKSSPERYVSGLDFKPSGLDDELVSRVLDAPVGEIILRGVLGPKEHTYGTRPLRVFEAYLGMPGVEPIEGDIFFKSQDRDPPVQCFTAPCPNEVAHRLNTSIGYLFDSYHVELAAKPHVDQDWLIDRVDNHGAIVAALFMQGTLFQGGYETVLDASQVYLNVADMTGPCPAFKLAACPEGEVWTYTRDENLCQIPNACVPDGNCPSLQPPRCEEGYTASGWRVDSPYCMKLACDPTFVLPY